MGSQVRLHVYVGIWEDVLIPPSIKALAVTAVLATCFGAGWSVNGWRKDSATQAEALARAAEAALYLTSVPDDVSDAAEVQGMPQKVDAPVSMAGSKINLAQAGTATIATVTGATEVLKTVGDFQESLQAIGPWLVPIACVAVVALCLFTIWQRYDLRKRGVV